MLICFDTAVPEAARAPALDGAQVIAFLGARPLGRLTPSRRIATDIQTRHLILLNQARAVEGQVVRASASMTGRHGGRGSVATPAAAG